MDISRVSAEHIRGATEDSIRLFPEYVKQMAPRPALVLLDQMLDHPVEKTPFMKGTDMITRLRDLGFEGKIVIYSESHTPRDARFYRECGAD